MAKQKTPKEVYAPNRKIWRQWLKKNHQSEEMVWLLMYKKDSGVSSVNYEEAVEEALCFGWIDSKPAKKDDRSFLLSFFPRRPRSVWSAINKKRVEKLVMEGQMEPAGLASVELARRLGSWEKLDAAEALIMPEVLEIALRKNDKARNHFAAFPASVKKGIYHWIIAARRQETIDRRVSETVTLAEKNIRANQLQPKKKNA